MTLGIVTLASSQCLSVSPLTCQTQVHCVHCPQLTQSKVLITSPLCFSHDPNHARCFPQPH